MNAYHKFGAARKARNEKNDCAVVAIAAATGIKYGKVHAVLKELGRRDGCSTSTQLIGDALDRLGVMYVPRGVPVFRENTRRLRRYMHAYGTEPRFIVWIPGHFTALVDGEYVDWVKDATRARKVKFVWEVLR